MDYNAFYKQIFDTLGDLTPLIVDCGVVCGRACCKGDDRTGMRLFPHEPTTLPVIPTEDGGQLVVCDGHCDRDNRPLSCRIFPFFPTIDEDGTIFVEPDDRARRLCPLITHADEIMFDERFFDALEEVGRRLAEDDECRRFLEETTDDIDMFRDFLG